MLRTPGPVFELQMSRAGGGQKTHFSYNLWSLTFLEELTLKQFYFKWKSGSEAAHG